MLSLHDRGTDEAHPKVAIHRPMIPPQLTANIRVIELPLSYQQNLPSLTSLRNLEAIIVLSPICAPAEDSSVPVKTEIVEMAREQILADAQWQGILKRLHGGRHHKAKTWAKVWIVDPIGDTLDLDAPYPDVAVRANWVEEIMVCIDDGRLFSLHHPREVLRKEGFSFQPCSLAFDVVVTRFWEVEDTESALRVMSGLHKWVYGKEMPDLFRFAEKPSSGKVGNGEGEEKGDAVIKDNSSGTKVDATADSSMA